MFREFLIEYKNGVFYSIQGFLVLHKLDRSPKDGRRASETRASSVDRVARQTVLERRRMKKEPNQQESSTSTAIRSKASARWRVMQCVGVNLIVMAVLQLLIWITEWLIPDQGSSLYAFCNIFRNTLILPIFIVIRVLSTLWFADIASAAYKYRGSPPSKDTTTIDIPRAASDFLHAIVLELVFLLQTLVISSVPVPIIFSTIGFVCMSILHSLYCFEYKWMSGGIEMTRRLDMVERRWAYHFGFGTLLTVLTSLSTDFVVNSCAFGAAFPFFIVSSFLAEIPEPANSDVPSISFFSISQFITTKISSAVSQKFSDSGLVGVRRS